MNNKVVNYGLGTSGAATGFLSSIYSVVGLAPAGLHGAAALTAGLAQLGGVVGGGMMSGLVVVAFSPLIGAASFLGGFYLIKSVKR